MNKDERNLRLYEGCINWIDREFSRMSKDERMKMYESYGWMFSDGSKTPTLEPLLIGNDSRVESFREKFREWFLVVCDYSLSAKHMGMTSYSHYLNHPHWDGCKSKGNKVYPQRVILSLGMMGIFSGMKTDYLHVNDKTRDHGRIYNVDVEKLKAWTPSWTPTPDDIWVSTSSDSEFDYCFLDGDDEESRQSWSQHDDWFSQRQYETISSLSVRDEDYEQAIGFMSTCTWGNLDSMDDKEMKELRWQYITSKRLVNLQNGIVGSCKVDDKGGRFYSMMVGLGRDSRRDSVLLDGEKVVEVDVSSAQPTLIGLKVKKETGQTTEWLSRCLSGGFYEWVKAITGTAVERDKVKKYVMRFLFSCYGSNFSKTYEGEHLSKVDGKEYKKGYKRFEQRLTSYLKSHEPETYELIEMHKRNPYWSDKAWTDSRGKRHYGKWCSPLPVEMQKVEVEFIKTCLSRLPDDLKFYTIHDAICVKESDGERVKEIMEMVSMELYGEKIAVKIENKS